MVTNEDFLKAIFGQDYIWSHVTDFTYDPTNIPKGYHLLAWSGDYFCRYKFSKSPSNQYFTISTFYCDSEQKARRRKALFRQTHCIILDDVKEKLAMEEVMKLPRPSWILESSQGSEQWGYILNTPCTERGKVENLLDGLVANGLAPNGKDPGMKGVTRYLRLPEGYNNKLSKLVRGQPFKCNLLLWEPQNKVTIEQLAIPFSVDLNAVRREERVDGAANISDHPLLHIPDLIQIKEVRSDGRFDIICPWFRDHTNQEDSGAAIFTNEDGTIGFKCHHGHCENKTAKDLLAYIDYHKPGWSKTIYKDWKIRRDFQNFTLPSVSTMTTENKQETENFITEQKVMSIEDLINQLHKMIPEQKETREFAGKILRHLEDYDKMDQAHYQERVRDIMRWSKHVFKEILKNLRKSWYTENVDADLYKDFIFIRELNQFYNLETGIFYTAEAFQNSYSNESDEVKKNALQYGLVRKVDKLDYAPGKPLIFTENGIEYGNAYSNKTLPKGYPGDVSPWRRHFEILGWTSEERDHIEKWMAYTLRYPEKKINHMLILGGSEGCGKDFLLYPLIKGMGDNCYVISGDELTSDFDDYLLRTKYLHVNETDLSDHREAVKIANKLKPIAAAPPERITVNQKNVKRIRIRNIINGTMTTNSYTPIKLSGLSRRFYALWSDVNMRDQEGQMRVEWLQYWKEHWSWMKNNGWENVLYYLYNNVDLTTFEPQLPPTVTDYLKDMQDMSKSPQQQTIEAFINAKIGLFKNDIMTPADISNTIRTESIFNEKHLYCDSKYLTPQNVGRTLQNAGYMVRRCRNNGDDVKLYIIRNHDIYRYKDNKEIYNKYHDEKSKLLGTSEQIESLM